MRSIERTTARKRRRIWSWSRLSTASIACSIRPATVSAVLVGLARVEARPEQVDQHRRDLRVVDEHLFDVAVAEGRAGLTQIARNGSQHRYLAPGQPGAEDRPVIAVVLDLAAPGLDERLAERLADAVRVGVAITAADRPKS